MVNAEKEKRGKFTMSIILVVGGSAVLVGIFETMVNCKDHIVDFHNRLKFRKMLRNRRNRHFILVVEEK